MWLSALYIGSLAAALAHNDALPGFCSGDGCFAGQIVEHDPLAGDVAQRAAEPIRVRVAALIEAERLFVQIPEQVKRLDADVERQNLSMRMGMRRFTRLSNGFSKKVENHAHAVALYFLHYNFARIHGTTRVTPAMAAGLADHVWGLEEIVGLLDRANAVAA